MGKAAAAAIVSNRTATRCMQCLYLLDNKHATHASHLSRNSQRSRHDQHILPTTSTNFPPTPYHLLQLTAQSGPACVDAAAHSTCDSARCQQDAAAYQQAANPTASKGLKQPPLHLKPCKLTRSLALRVPAQRLQRGIAPAAGQGFAEPGLTWGLRTAPAS